MPIQEVSIDAPIEEKISWARGCYEKIQDRLLRDIRICHLLKALEKAVQASHREMADAGVVNECRRCEEREGGSCCGAGMENRYSGLLLLANLLLGVKLPKRRYDPRSCFFLGNRGCLLLARHTICVNYLCKKITDHIDPPKIMSLREKEGIEQQILFLLHEQLKKRLRAGERLGEGV